MTRIVEGRRHWFDRSSVEREADRRTRESQWVSYLEAARIVGCSPGAIATGVKRGEIAHRQASRGPRGGRASLDIESVYAFRDARTARIQAAKARTEERLARTRPPDDGDVWVSTEVAALILRLSPSRVRQLAQADRLPCERVGRLLWFRRSDVERISSARSFTALMKAARADAARENHPAPQPVE
ncbi:helix-turn-helix domain-containing protein [Nocardioides sp. KR10-350]|uniref:helix-turn-helix domain-containing protein n=1 Tax=Nocardioides cheoyonin TaxID=3156615 RepID=UPI0032B3884E